MTVVFKSTVESAIMTSERVCRREVIIIMVVRLDENWDCLLDVDGFWDVHGDLLVGGHWVRFGHWHSDGHFEWDLDGDLHGIRNVFFDGVGHWFLYYDWVGLGHCDWVWFVDMNGDLDWVGNWDLRLHSDGVRFGYWYSNLLGDGNMLVNGGSQVDGAMVLVSTA